jgi:proteasome lid subunit RPN8/RPN11
MTSSALDRFTEAFEHAVQEYPHEACGILLGKPDSEKDDELFKCTNIQNKMHELDPETFTRDARTAYYIDPKELMSIFKKAESEGLSVKMFYHSHPDHDAYFSEEDKKMALFDGEPVYPDARYMVISVYNKEVKDKAVFEWNSESKTFERGSF